MASSTDYTLIFWCALLCNCVVTYRNSGFYQKKNKESNENNAVTEEDDKLVAKKKAHRSLMISYLSVYLLAALSDWLQGPYVYALYSQYGYAQQAIAVLFVAGFGSSMIFGSFVGSLADGCGRRKFVLLFCVTYGLSCITKHVKSFTVLLVGRFLGGVATSLLFSVFDSWLIKAHSKVDLGGEFLAKSFATNSYGNSVVAIIAGLIANHVAEYNKLEPLNGNAETSIHVGGFINPFDAALVALLLCASLTLYLWEENYGDSTTTNLSFSALKSALDTTLQKADILHCGLISSFFEGSMYVFVFMWTPALTSLANETSETNTLPFGLIFSTFMVCCMIGSGIFSVLISKGTKIESLGVFVLAMATTCFVVMTLSSSETITFLSMNLFEISVGMYFPVMGTLKSQIVPENQRSAIYNLYRIPLNFIVLSSLLTKLSFRQSFGVCFAMLCVANFLMTKLSKSRSKAAGESSYSQVSTNSDAVSDSGSGGDSIELA